MNVCRGVGTYHDIDILTFVGFHVFRDRTEVLRLEGMGIRLFKWTEDTIVARALFVTHFKNEGDRISSGSRCGPAVTPVVWKRRSALVNVRR